MKLWKIYFIFMCLLLVVYFIANIFGADILGWIDMLVNVISLLALYGFCFNKRIFFRLFWKVGFVCCCAFEVLVIGNNFLKAMGYPKALLVLTGFTLIILPIYIAMFNYAFKREDVWERTVQKINPPVNS